jgi:hypothetical protein
VSRRAVEMKPSGRALEATFSREETMQHLGCKKSKLHELCALGRKFHGCHPIKGGLWPTFPVSHKNLRIPEGAIERHRNHMMRLRDDAMFAAQMKAAARRLGERVAA